MFTVTDSALEQLSNALGQIDDPKKPDDACFRIVPKVTGQLMLTVDTPTSDDTEYAHDGTTVLVLSEDIRDRCDGRTLDSDGTGNLVLT